MRPEQVFVANGSNEVIQAILLAYGGAGRKIATFEPTYQMYAQIARVTGAQVVEGERKSDLTLDVAEIQRVVKEHQPSVTFLCNPNNPTGLVEPEHNLRALLKVATGLWWWMKRMQSFPIGLQWNLCLMMCHLL